MTIEQDSIFTIIPEPLLIQWIMLSPGAFHVSTLSKDVDRQQLYIDMLERMVDRGYLTHYGDKRGWYEPRKTELVEMDYKGADETPIDIWLPFGLSDYVQLFDNSVVIISGAPNAGKSGIIYNMIRENQGKDWDQYLFNSEGSAGELKKRLNKFDYITIDQWKFTAYYRAGDFADVIRPGKNSINYIDFLEVHDEFYKMGGYIKAIHDRLDGGIAVIAIQKNPGSDTGMGGYRSMEVTRLALALDFQRVKITKAKNFVTKDNPNGWSKSFKMTGGCNITYNDGWDREVKKEDSEPI